MAEKNISNNGTDGGYKVRIRGHSIHPCHAPLFNGFGSSHSRLSWLSLSYFGPVAILTMLE